MRDALDDIGKMNPLLLIPKSNVVVHFGRPPNLSDLAGTSCPLEHAADYTLLSAKRRGA